MHYIYLTYYNYLNIYNESTLIYRTFAKVVGYLFLSFMTNLLNIHVKELKNLEKRRKKKRTYDYCIPAIFSNYLALIVNCSWHR